MTSLGPILGVVRVPSEIGEVGLDSFCLWLKQDVLLAFGFLAASTLPVNVNPTGLRQMEKLVSERWSGEGGPLLLSTGKLRHG